MKIKKPAEEVDVCDLCQRETGSLLTQCIICGKEYCFSCNAYFPGCWVRPNVCKKCGGKNDVISIVGKYADKITPIIRERDKILSELPISESEEYIDETMDIYSSAGTKVRFLNKNGYDNERETAAKVFDTTTIYTVKNIEVHSSVSYVTLEEYPERSYNSVMFTEVIESEKDDD